MSTTELHFSRVYDLPPVIVWDALVDEDLVDGWLASARIDARVGGEFRLEWMVGARLAPSNGVITAFEPPSHLAVDTDNIGSFDFTLTEVPGGSRGSSTDLRITMLVDTEPRLLASTRAHWRTNLDQLESLLRGHPVDWSTWQEDRGEAWSAYLAEAADPD